MPGGLLLHRVDQDQRAPRKLSLVRLRVDPDGKEHRAKVALARGFEVEIAVAERVAQIEVLVDKALRRIDVSVNDESGALNFFGA